MYVCIYVMFRSLIKKEARFFTVQILLIYEHLFYKYFICLSFGYWSINQPTETSFLGMANRSLPSPTYSYLSISGQSFQRFYLISIVYFRLTQKKWDRETLWSADCISSVGSKHFKDSGISKVPIILRGNLTKP